MKKIRLFLITLLCVVGVMNVSAQQVITQVVNETNGTLQNGNWQSKAVYGENGGHLVVDNSALLNNAASVRFNNGNLQFHLIRANTITIIAPAGYVIDRYKITVACDRASVTCNNVTKSDGTFDVRGEYERIDFTIQPDEGDWTWSWDLLDNLPHVNCTDFVVYFREKTVSATNFYDSDRAAIVSGAMYVLSTQLSEDNDRYFTVNGTSVKAGGWPGINKPNSNEESALIDVNAVWELSLLAPLTDKKITLSSMTTNKYLGDATGNQPTVSSESKTDAMQFVYDGPTSQSRTPNFYTLEVDGTYLNYTGNANDALSMWTPETHGLWPIIWTDSPGRNQKFRFHRVEYVRIGVFTEKNGILVPMHFTVNMIVDKRTDSNNHDISLYQPVGLKRFGQSEICCEHHVTGRVPTEYINDRIKGIIPDPSEVPEGVQPKYIVNGVVMSEIPYAEIESGYNISIIYVIPTDPTEPDPEFGGAKFYKLKTNVNNKYLSAKVAGENSSLSIENEGNDAIFYHDGTSLLSYTNGVYVKDNTLGAIEEDGSEILLVKYTSNNGKWDVRLGSQYLTCDNGGGNKPMFAVKPSGEYDLIPVTELPVKMTKIADHRYGTFYAPVAVSVPEGLEAYVVTGTEEGTSDYDLLTLESVSDKTIPANVAVILYKEYVGEGEPETVYYDAPILNSSTATGSSKLDGVYARKWVGDKTVYGLNKKMRNGKEQVGFYKMKSTSALSSFRAFFDYSDNPSKNFVFSFDETNAIEDVSVSTTDRVIFDLQGRRVQNPGTGIYIVNGKKVMLVK